MPYIKFPFYIAILCCFKNSFFSSIINGWSKLDKNSTNPENYEVYGKSSLRFKVPSASSNCNCQNPKGKKLIIGFGLSHLHYHEFKVIF